MNDLEQLLPVFRNSTELLVSGIIRFMPPIQLATFIHPAKAYRLQYPAHWEHLEKDDGRSWGFGPRDRDDVGLWITILPVSIDSERLEQDLPKIFRQAISDESTNVRRDPTLRHFGLIADIAKGEDASKSLATVNSCCARQPTMCINAFESCTRTKTTGWRKTGSVAVIIGFH